MVRAHAEEGVDFVTIHAGLNRKAIDSFKRSGRKMNIVSREMCIRDRPIYERAIEEHYDYEHALEQCGVDVTVLPALEEYPCLLYTSRCV